MASMADILRDIVTTLGGTYSASDDTVSELLARIDAAYKAGGGGGSSLPAVTSADNGDLLGVVEGAWGKVDPPADTFTVTLTENDGNWTADKTIAEILAANAAGKQCVATAIIDDTTVFFPLVTTSQGLVQFAGTSYTESANATYVAGIIDGSADKWFLNSVEITNELPSVTSSDNGSLLGVSDGAWAKVDPQPNIFEVEATLTIDGNSKQIFTTNKTAAEGYAAVSAGKLFKVSFTIEEGTTSEFYTECKCQKVDVNGTVTYTFAFIDNADVLFRAEQLAGTDTVVFTEK